MKIGNIEINLTEDILNLKKSKSGHDIGKMIILSISLLIVYPIIYLLVKEKTISDFGIPDLLISLTIIVLTVIFFLYNWKRDKIKFKEILLRKKSDKVLINNLFFCELNRITSIDIVEFADGDGASSYNIEISCDKKSFSVCMDQGKKDAIAIASVIGQFLNKDIAFKKGKTLIP